MAQHDEEIEQDLSHIHWSWPEAIFANPARSLATSDLAMDYFAYSPFWDTKSNNNVLRTQRRVENPTYGHAEEKQELNAFKSGFEYIVSHSLPPELFVIHRREVDNSGKRDRVTGAWFILNDKIYQCPTLYDVISTRLKNAASLISTTLNSFSESRPPANPRSTTTWRALPPSTSTSSSSDSRTQTPVDTNPQDVLDTDDEEKKEDKVASTATAATAQPDWHLFHALSSTRESLASLDEKAHAPIPPADPQIELKALEQHLSNQLFPNINHQQQRASASGSSRARSTSIMGLVPPSNAIANTRGGMTPMSMSLGGASPARLAGSPASIAMGLGRGAPSPAGAWIGTPYS